MSNSTYKHSPVGFTVSGICRRWRCRLAAPRNNTCSARPLTIRQAGFTIVELMIATLVFSVILVIITAGVIAITKTYYKGVTINRTQNVARGIMDSISQAVQFSGYTPLWPAAGSAQGRGCFGSTAYDFQLGKILGSTTVPTDESTNHVLSIAPTSTDCVAATTPSFNTNSSEQLSQHMRLVKLNVVPVSNPNPNQLWRVDVTVAYGDNDLLCDNTSPATDAGSCKGALPFAASSLENFPADHMLTCRSGAGSSFCAVSALSSIVQQRLVPNE